MKDRRVHKLWIFILYSYASYAPVHFPTQRNDWSFGNPDELFSNLVCSTLPSSFIFAVKPTDKSFGSSAQLNFGITSWQENISAPAAHLYTDFCRLCYVCKNKEPNEELLGKWAAIASVFIFLSSTTPFLYHLQAGLGRDAGIGAFFLYSHTAGSLLTQRSPLWSFPVHSWHPLLVRSYVVSISHHHP